MKNLATLTLSAVIASIVIGAYVDIFVLPSHPERWVQNPLRENLFVVFLVGGMGLACAAPGLLLGYFPVVIKLMKNKKDSLQNFCLTGVLVAVVNSAVVYKVLVESTGRPFLPGLAMFVAAGLLVGILHWVLMHKFKVKTESAVHA